MSAINLAAQRALTEKRGKELDRWIEMKCIRFMSGIKPFSPTLSELPTEILHHIVEKMEPADILSSREVCRSIRNVVNEFAIRFGGITLFLRNNTVFKHTSPTFTGMPTKIINQVVEKMEPMDRLRSSKVCRSLRTAVDKFGFRFGHIRLNLWRNQIDIVLSGSKIRYTTAANGNSNVIHNEQEKLIDGEHFVERAAKDLKIVSKHTRKIGIWNQNKEKLDWTFIELLKLEKCIHVKEIEFWHFSLDDVLTILPRFNAKKLKTIKLLWVKSIDQFERITHLEPWKKAEEFRINCHKCTISSTMIAHFFHFKLFHIYQMDEFFEQTAIQIRDDLLRRSTFQSCEIYFDKTKINPIEIARVFNPDYDGDNEFNIEYSNGNDKFNISLYDFSFFFELKVKRL